jgi:ATP-dependent DNA helicase RecG
MRRLSALPFHAAIRNSRSGDESPHSKVWGMVAGMSNDPLQTPVQFVRGGGEHRAELLARLGINTVEDLLWTLPRDVLDFTDVRRPRDIKEGEPQTVRGSVVDVDARPLSRGRTVVSALLDCGDDYVRGVWFNQPWMRQQIQMGEILLFSGKPRRKQGRWEFAHPKLQKLEEGDLETDGGMLPRYALTEGLKMAEMRRIARNAVAEFADHVNDHLPEKLRASRRLIALPAALRGVHTPSTPAEYEAARRRLIFDDLLEFELGVALRRQARREGGRASALNCTAKIDARIRRLFPFRLTAGQEQAIAEITADLAKDEPMHRLLQAEVGAGKTVIAIYAMLVAVANGQQAGLMAPTELLAAQHWETVDAALSESQVNRLLLTGDLTAAQRRDALERIAAGEVQLVIGTQAMIQEDVRFANLGVVVIDEQHRFGVAQRSRFAGSAAMPHVLVMTATPIPRSLCLTQYGDLDLTVVRDVPPGRQPVITSRVRGREEQARVWEFLRKQLRTGRQAYVVCPRVESDGPGARDAAADRVLEYLSRTELNGFRLGLAHGRMDREQRSRTMQSFRDGDTNVLVSTTVIEVGVDVPNATLMVVLQAERFGLAQLHQMRGRVARGVHSGFCFLFSESSTDEAVERLGALESSTNGFEIAEKDFELRGPGDILGTRQHGETPFRVADLTRDGEVLREARTAAEELVGSGKFDEPPCAALKSRVLSRFGRLFELPQSG